MKNLKSFKQLDENVKAVTKPTLDKEKEAILMPNEHDAKAAIETLVKGGMRKQYIHTTGKYNDTLKFVNSSEFKKAKEILKLDESINEWSETQKLQHQDELGDLVQDLLNKYRDKVPDAYLNKLFDAIGRNKAK